MYSWQEAIKTPEWEEADETRRRAFRNFYWKKLSSQHPELADRRDEFFEQTEPDVAKIGTLKAGVIGVTEGTGLGPLGRVLEPIAEKVRATVPKEAMQKALQYSLIPATSETFLPTKEELGRERTELEAAKRQHPIATTGGEFLGLAAGPGKFFGALGGARALPRVLARMGAWGTYGGGRELEKQLREEEVRPLGIVKEAALWGGMELGGEAVLKAAKIGKRLLKKPKIALAETAENQAKQAETKLKLIAPEKRLDIKVKPVAEERYLGFGMEETTIPSMEITVKAASGEEVVFDTMEAAQDYIRSLPPNALGPASIRQGMKGTVTKQNDYFQALQKGQKIALEAETPEFKEIAIQSELSLMAKEAKTKEQRILASLAAHPKPHSGPKVEEYRSIAYDRAKKKLLGLDPTGIGEKVKIGGKAPLSPKYVANPPGSCYAPDPILPEGADIGSMQIGAWGGKTLPTKSVFSKFAKIFNDNRWYTGWREIRDNFQKMVKWQFAKQKELREIIGSLQNNTESLVLIGKYLEKRAPAAELTSSELEIAAKLRPFLDDLFFKEMKMSWDRYITDYLPHFKRLGKFDPRIATGDPIAKKSIQWLNELERKNLLHVYEENVLVALDRYIAGAARRKFLKEPYDLLKSLQKSLPRNSQEYNTVDEFLADVYGFPNFRGYFEKALRRVVHNDDDRVRQYLGFGSRLAYSGGLALRPAVHFRNLCQQSLAMPVMGHKYWLIGMKGALKATERARIKGLDILPEAYHPIAAGQEFMDIVSMGSTGKWWDKVIDASLWSYRKSDYINRYVVFRGYEQKILDLCKQDLTWAKFYEKANLKFFDDAVVHDLQRLFNEGKVVKNYSKLAREGAKNLVEDSQWIYAKGMSPAMIRSNPSFFQFGTWPANAVHYMKKLSRLGPSGIAKLTGFWGTVMGVGLEVFGVDVRSWIPVNSLMYKGGPVVSLGWDTMDFARTIMSQFPETEGLPKKAWNKLLQDLWIWAPAGLEIKGIARAMEGDEEAIKRILGFRPKKKPEKRY